MQKRRFLNTLIVAFGLALIAFACKDDEDGPGTGFKESSSSVAENAGTILIPIRNRTVSMDDIELEGTAEEGTDYEILSVTEEGIEIAILQDLLYEPKETISLEIPGSGNDTHVVVILCDAGDTGDWDMNNFSGIWRAVEDYGTSEFGPYSVTIVQDEADENKFYMTNFYGSGAAYEAYMVFDFEAGTVSFPDQSAGEPGAITNSTGTFSLCDETITLNLTYDGGPWTYRISRN